MRLGPHSFPHLPYSSSVNCNRRNSPPLVPAQCLSCNVFPLFVSSCVHSVTSSLMCLRPSPLSPRGPFLFFIFFPESRDRIQGSPVPRPNPGVASPATGSRGRQSRDRIQGSPVPRLDPGVASPATGSRGRQSCTGSRGRQSSGRIQGSPVQRPDPGVASPAAGSSSGPPVQRPAPALSHLSSGQLQPWAACPAPAPALGRLSSGQLQLQLWAACPVASSSSSSGPPVQRPAPAPGLPLGTYLFI